MSSGESLDIVRSLRKPGRAPIHVETCAHYLSLSSLSPAGILGKVNPPLRPQADIDALWEGVRRGEISTIGSDHVPRKRSTKGTDIWRASAGFPGIATLLPVLIEEGYHKRGIPIETLAAATSANVARLYSIPSKGSLAPGYDADLTVLDPDGAITVDAANLESHSDYSPYEGMAMRGCVTCTILRGQVIAEHGRVTGNLNAGGHYLFRSPT